ncbi:contact-dependent growth inhibition system immunity protein [Actinoplanes sp. NPDC051513]|uniref:contact-dependent growth inhibition system immunity protein n=1 Tax=Actinoplanes sp. NPDC051513 TaxID=3363908 RepID=UPI0037956E6C
MNTDASIEEFEGDDWGDPSPDATRLVATVLRLRRRPVRTLGVEDLRVLAGQAVGLAVVVPLALDILERDPLAEGDFYPGDLLSAVLRAPADYWRAHPAQAARLRAVDTESVDDGQLKTEISAFGAAGY